MHLFKYFSVFESNKEQPKNKNVYFMYFMYFMYFNSGHEEVMRKDFSLKRKRNKKKPYSSCVRSVQTCKFILGLIDLKKS